MKRDFLIWSVDYFSTRDGRDFLEALAASKLSQAIREDESAKKKDDYAGKSAV
jgi:hypothetical protein